MNAKKAKALRRMVKALIGNRPTPYGYEDHTGLIPVYGRTTGEDEPVLLGQRQYTIKTLRPQSERAIYHQFKKYEEAKE